ncbi:hypothetical protein RvY_06103 [Ramazzottius varieornatus]|uniref:PPPDE domain-containing protein n=1 Tax=Ramazzottius varieornatus TaxID=947166 RepID=A0A1D1V0Y3_RAMVA|nr:hypothetical protein RvY_06103 [Ramazzottius varieornatus]
MDSWTGTIQQSNLCREGAAPYGVHQCTLPPYHGTDKLSDLGTDQVRSSQRYEVQYYSDTTEIKVFVPVFRSRGLPPSRRFLPICQSRSLDRLLLKDHSEMAETPVKLYIYDLSKGMARALSQMWLGKHLDGVWHTGVVAYNKEYFYGGMGIENCPPGTLQMGPPDTVVDLGLTGIPFELFLDWMNGMAMTTFKGSRYHLLDHNCNTFSNEMAQFLTGKSIPSYITDLPSELLSTPLGQQIRLLLDQAANSATATPVGTDPSREFGEAPNAPPSNRGPSSHNPSNQTHLPDLD